MILLGVSLFILNLIPTYAQIGNLGIYGSAPTASPTPFTCGDIRYARLELYPSDAEGDGIGWNYIIPVNGLKNFNFFYTADGTGFLSGGGYKVTYLNASQVNCYGISDVVYYRANAGHTIGVQVRPFNNPPATPLGIHGIFRGYVPGGSGSTVALENALVFISYPGVPLIRAKTNGIGYYSIYYGNENPNVFVPPINNWSLLFQGYYNGCGYSHTYTGIIWFPVTDPNSPAYYVNGAEWDHGTLTLTSPDPGCQP